MFFRKKAIILGTCFFWFFLQSCLINFHSTKKTYFKALKQEPYDVIIVPGYPYTGAQWDKVVDLRIVWANYLYNKGYAKNIIFSGSSVYSPYIESRIMALYAIALGVPKEHVFTEESAEHSTENVYYSYVLAKHLGFKKIALATDPFQTNSLRSFIRKFEIPVSLLPAVFDTLRTLEVNEPQIDPSTAHVDNFISIKTRQSFFKRIKGTFGKYIIWHEEDLKKKRFRRRFKNRMIIKNPQ